jgi:nicotinate-nucleotide adenylyltransferase
LKRIGLFGGSFDPVHNAHVALAQIALDHLQLDEVRWIPAGQPWQKTRSLAPAEHRAAMVALAIQGEPRFTLERCELDRNGPSYTLDTVRELQAAQPGAQWFLIIGQDQYAGLHTWNDWQALLALVTLAVAQRPGAPGQGNPDVTRVAHAQVALPMMDISSTDIRQRVAEGRDFTDMVPAAVARYIDQHHLYRGQSRS